ncbi:DUF2752 domain-containing protein [Sphingobacterium bovistauri]|uniref:DUF2752 domain-containing protein n=1 Tax=Sphingobacterium bovistauri TaxID=2781959 RepID=A0ABS7Z3U1_9SPHI|nr:DUF2752 domain-containing protein [Sphingobacterium bovistauri]MCA5004846.1 DUF2752 domain-containing protein [Sphingobacterium bovistauri]
MSKFKQLLKSLPLELIIWVVALIVLYHLDVHDKEANSLCPIHSAGLGWCPGCGLGRAIGLLMHGYVSESIEMHWFGIPTFLVLLYRILNLFILYIQSSKIKI